MSTNNAADLTATDLVTGYRIARTTRVVTRTSFSIPVGAVAAVVGPNGAGKTTLLKTLVGLLPPLGGSVTLGGVALTTHRLLHGVGYLPETLQLMGAWSGRGLLALAALAGGARSPDSAPDALALAGIDFDLAEPVSRLSKGQRQRLAIAMALLPLPGLLLLDEPEAGLDPAQRIGLRQRIQEFARDGRIVLLASHDLSGLCTIADRTYVMRGDRMEPLPQDALTDRARITELFGGGGRQ